MTGDCPEEWIQNNFELCTNASGVILKGRLNSAIDISRTYGTWTAESRNGYTKIDAIVPNGISGSSSITYFIDFVDLVGSNIIYYGMLGASTTGYKLGGELPNGISSRGWIDYGAGMAGIYISLKDNSKDYNAGSTGSYLLAGQLYKLK